MLAAHAHILVYGFDAHGLNDGFDALVMVLMQAWLDGESSYRLEVEKEKEAKQGVCLYAWAMRLPRLYTGNKRVLRMLFNLLIYLWACVIHNVPCVCACVCARTGKEKGTERRGN